MTAEAAAKEETTPPVADEVTAKEETATPGADEVAAKEETTTPEPVHPIDQLPADRQIQLWKVRATNFELTALNNQIQAMNEAQRRATIEVQTLPGKMQELQKTLEGKRQNGQAEYDKLKEMTGCPEGRDIDLDTGLIIGD